jgi:hypothetical protein
LSGGGKPEGMVPGKATSLPAALAATPPLKDVPAISQMDQMPARNMTGPVEARMDEVFPASPAPMTPVTSGQSWRTPANYGMDRQ